MIQQASLSRAYSPAMRPWSHFRPSSPRSNRRSSGLALFDALRALDLFARLEDDELLKLAVLGSERRMGKGEVILHQSAEACAYFFVVVEGEAAASWEDSRGKECHLATLAPGDVAGELELFGIFPGDATVRARTPVRLIAWKQEEFLAAIRTWPELALGMLADMARRIRLFRRRVAGVGSQKATRRLAFVLMSLIEEEGVRSRDSAGAECLLLRRPPTRQRLSDLAGMARETVSRILIRWEKAGWVAGASGGLKVLDESRLRALAGA